MLANPSLVKRPVLAIDAGGKTRLLVGFSADAYEAASKSGG
jgi:arsenate reductase-like glutaredoxin family protein